MHVVATAGHVDHGKSTLVEALTGMQPDRLDEERRRGLSIELGYCWTTLPVVGDVAFVDVPGHERFVPTMLAGVGPVPAVLFVVAADDPWMPQAAEHLAALDAFGVRHGVAAVTRSDLADPHAMMQRTRAELDRTALAGSPVLSVSARAGNGLDELRAELAGMLRSFRAPAADEDVRLWVDRCFTVRGAGTVVTGTLPAGRIRVGDTLAAGDGSVRVRGVQSMGREVDEAVGVARVALNVTGEGRSGLDRHSVLVTPGAWQQTQTLDARLTLAAGDFGRRVPPKTSTLHAGSVSSPAHVRPLGNDTARLILDRPLPMRVGDHALLRDPGSRRLWGVTVLDPAPPTLHGRGSAHARAEVLAESSGASDLRGEVTRRGMVHRDLLRRIGVRLNELEQLLAAGELVAADDWLLSRREADAQAVRLAELVQPASSGGRPGADGVLLTVAADQLGLPSAAVARAVVRDPWHVADGRVTQGSAGTPAELPADIADAVALLDKELADEPFAAPTADRMRELGLDARAVALAVRAGRTLHLGDGVVLLPGADVRAVDVLRTLPQPFTTSQARTALHTSRRVALPLLKLLDRRGFTRRLPDDRREVVTRRAPR